MCAVLCLTLRSSSSGSDLSFRVVDTDMKDTWFVMTGEDIGLPILTGAMMLIFPLDFLWTLFHCSTALKHAAKRMSLTVAPTDFDLDLICLSSCGFNDPWQK